MGLGDFFKGGKKDAVESTANDVDTEQINEVSSQEMLDNQNTDKEEEKVAITKTKKKYMYIALDVEGNAVIDHKGEVFTRVVEDGSSPEWQDNIRLFADKVLLRSCMSHREKRSTCRFRWWTYCTLPILP